MGSPGDCHAPRTEPKLQEHRQRLAVSRSTAHGCRGATTVCLCTGDFPPPKSCAFPLSALPVDKTFWHRNSICSLLVWVTGASATTFYRHIWFI